MGKRTDAVPIRTCISCGAKRPKGDLVRLALDPEGRAVEDERGTKPGRGAYVCRGGPCLERLTRPRWERAFRIRGGTRKSRGPEGVDGGFGRRANQAARRGAGSES